MGINTTIVQDIVGVTPWDTPTLTTTRPRLFFYPNTRLTRAINNWTTPPSNMTALKSSWIAEGSGSVKYAIAQAMIYLIGGNNSTNLTNAYNFASAETFSIPSSVNASLSSLASPFVLDFCYNGLSTAQRNTLITNCENFAQAAETAFTGGTGSRTLDLANAFTDQGLMVYAYCVLAAEGETGFTSRIAKLRNVLQHHQLWYDEQGKEGFRSTYSYQVQQNASAYIAYHIAAGEESLLPGRVGYLAGQTDYLSRHLSSAGKDYQGEMAANHRVDINRNIIEGGFSAAWACVMFADVYNDNTAQWLAGQQLATQNNKWTQNGLSVTNEATWLAFPFYDPNRTQTSPSAAGFPLSVNSPVQGTTYTRAAWPAGTGTVSTFFCQPCAADSHCDPGAGTFWIKRNDDWLIADGYNYPGRDSTWEKDPASGGADISGCVGNYTMCRSGILFVPSGVTNYQRAGSNLSLSSLAHTTPSGSSAAYPWSWALFVSRGYGTQLCGATPRYTNNIAGSPPEINTVGNCTNAWNNTTQVSSHFRYFSEIPGIGGTGTSSQRTFVIRDHFTAVGGMTNVMLNFWCKAKPSISGQTVVQGTTNAGVIKCTGNSCVITSTSGLSQATIQMVQPSSPALVFLVGGGNGIAGAPAGPGYESFFDFDPTTGLGGANLDFATNAGTPPTDNRIISQYPWIKGQWCVYYTTTAATSGGEIVMVITIDAAGTTAPTYNLAQAQTMAPIAFTNFNPNPPSAPVSGQVLLPAEPPALGGVLFELKGANMNTTNDQVFSSLGNYPNGYAVNAIYATNPSISLTAAQGGIWAGLSQTGNNLVANTQAYSALTGSTKLLNTTLASGATQNVQTVPPVLSLSAPQGAAATADFYVLGSDLSAGGAPQPPPPPVLNASGAQWIAPIAATASTLETGDIIQITAWAPPGTGTSTEYGYAYTFSLSGAPAGVTIDSDLGRINISSALSVNTYNFHVIATNREQNTISNSFPFTLNILAGVVGTPGVPTLPTASQIMHVTYDPASGTWGNPTGNDWTSVFNSMKSAILSDQAKCIAVRDESLRVDIPLQRGTTYQYTNNTWLTGIQYFNVHDAGSGSLPALQCTSTAVFDVDHGPLNIGWPGAALGPGNGGSFQPPAPPASGVKANTAKIATTASGDTTVTLLSSGDASKLVAGRWHLICSQCIQIGGWPPNCSWIDYVKVVSVVGTTVTLDRPLKYIHRQDFYENTSDDQSLGVARIIPYDTGGPGGYTPLDPRCGIRCSVTNLQFLKNPNYSALAASIHQTQGFIDFTYDGCTMLSPNPTELKHVLFRNSSFGAGGEWDKLSETAFHDGCVSAAFNSSCDRGSATSFMYVLFRNSHMAPMQISPRQLRVLTGSNIDALGDTFFLAPISYSYNGAIMYMSFESCTLQGSSGSHDWSFGQSTGSGNTMNFVVGTDFTWSGNTIVFPKSTVSNSQFENALVKVFEGMIIDNHNGLTPITTNWGYVSKVYSAPDQSAMWLDVVWVNGTMPTTNGTTVYFHRKRRLNWSQVALGTAGGITTTWTDPGFTKTTSPGNVTYGFPTGYPSPYNE